MIARHHAQHVREFLTREKMDDCEVGIEIISPMRATAWCRATEAARTTIEQALRPPRVVE
jgi:hypothetical protein